MPGPLSTCSAPLAPRPTAVRAPTQCQSLVDADMVGAAIEEMENLFLLFRRNAWTAILNHDCKGRLSGRSHHLGRNGNASTGRCVFAGVVQQIVEDLGKTFGIEQHEAGVHIGL